MVWRAGSWRPLSCYEPSPRAPMVQTGTCAAGRRLRVPAVQVLRPPSRARKSPVSGGAPRPPGLYSGARQNCGRQGGSMSLKHARAAGGQSRQTESAPRPTPCVVRPPRGMRNLGAARRFLMSAPRPAEAGRPPWGTSKVAKPHLLVRLRVNRSCPLITPKDARSSLRMLAIARAMAVLRASIGRLLTRCSATLAKLSASEVPRRGRVHA